MLPFRKDLARDRLQGKKGLRAFIAARSHRVRWLVVGTQQVELETHLLALAVAFVVMYRPNFPAHSVSRNELPENLEINFGLRHVRHLLAAHRQLSCRRAAGWSPDIATSLKLRGTRAARSSVMNLAVLATLCAFLLASCAPAAERESGAESRPLTSLSPLLSSSRGLTLVKDPSAVCMVNDRYMGTRQIPVSVDGKTYYGCCKMCEARLKQETRIRFGLDPVSKRSIDKATAVIARSPAGDVLYFESEESLRSYNAGP